MSSTPESFVGFDPNKDQFDHFTKAIYRDDRKKRDAGLSCVASMLLAALSWLTAALGHEEAERIYRDYGDQFFKRLRVQ